TEVRADVAHVLRSTRSRGASVPDAEPWNIGSLSRSCARRDSVRTEDSMKRLSSVLLAITLGLFAACGPDGAPESQRAILREHVPSMKRHLQQDRERHYAGIVEAARLVAPGFLVEDPAARERQMRTALRRIQEP